MNPLILPLALGLSGLYLLTKDGEPKIGPQPSFTPGALDSFTEMRTLPSGQRARYFKADIVSQLMGMLSAKSLAPVQSPAQGGQVFKVVDLSPVPPNARDAAQLANSQNLVVMGSLSLPLVQSDVDKLLVFAISGQRSMANEKGQFAILLDAGSEGTASVPPPPATPLPTPAETPFDANMDPELVKMVNAMLADPNADPEALEAAADDLEKSGFPVAGKALRARAAVLRLQRKTQDHAAGGTPIVIPAGGGGIALYLPAYLANYYTGDQMRWREIAAVNPKVGMIVTHGNLSPWKGGMTVLLPTSWNVRSKPLPPPQGVPAKVQPAPAPSPDETPFGPPEAPGSSAHDPTADSSEEDA